VDGEQSERDRQVCFAHTARTEQDDVLTALDEAQPGESWICWRGAALAKAKS
jgi:hypothetical protein